MAHGIGLSLAHRPYVPTFLPTDVSNLALWLKYNTGHTSENDETTAAGDIDDDDRIKQWDDQSGNNNHAAQSTAGDMPRYVSSSGALKFACFFGRGAGARAFNDCTFRYNATGARWL